MNEDYFCLLRVSTYIYDLKYMQRNCTKLRISNCNTDNSMLSVSAQDTNEAYLILMVVFLESRRREFSSLN